MGGTSLSHKERNQSSNTLHINNAYDSTTRGCLHAVLFAEITLRLYVGVFFKLWVPVHWKLRTLSTLFTRPNHRRGLPHSRFSLPAEPSPCFYFRKEWQREICLRFGRWLYIAHSFPPVSGIPFHLGPLRPGTDKTGEVNLLWILRSSMVPHIGSIHEEVRCRHLVIHYVAILQGSAPSGPHTCQFSLRGQGGSVKFQI